MSILYYYFNTCRSNARMAPRELPTMDFDALLILIEAEQGECKDERASIAEGSWLPHRDGDLHTEHWQVNVLDVYGKVHL